jgi:hypothetical protein
VVIFVGCIGVSYRLVAKVCGPLLDRMSSRTLGRESHHEVKIA